MRRFGTKMLVFTNSVVVLLPSHPQVQKEALSKVRVGESEWQGKAARWLYTAKRKVELKAREDDEAEASKKRKGRG